MNKPGGLFYGAGRVLDIGMVLLHSQLRYEKRQYLAFFTHPMKLISGGFVVIINTTKPLEMSFIGPSSLNQPQEVGLTAGLCSTCMH